LILHSVAGLRPDPTKAGQPACWTADAAWQRPMLSVDAMAGAR